MKTMRRRSFSVDASLILAAENVCMYDLEKTSCQSSGMSVVIEGRGPREFSYPHTRI